MKEKKIWLRSKTKVWFAVSWCGCSSEKAKVVRCATSKATTSNADANDSPATKKSNIELNNAVFSGASISFGNTDCMHQIPIPHYHPVFFYKP
ncbi:hypothetical protein EB796_008074 [Bugula neritina]|uniref:Uncharacterized protein n=1 Tax=Bugula neritina TaxID=10212 RepID=A0A7J7K6M6_BUGNE|nr:hypothetical protein EB796_008074 [Bugula neritina]